MLSDEEPCPKCGKKMSPYILDVYGVKHEVTLCWYDGWFKIMPYSIFTAQIMHEPTLMNGIIHSNLLIPHKSDNTYGV